MQTEVTWDRSQSHSEVIPNGRIDESREIHQESLRQRLHIHYCQNRHLKDNFSSLCCFYFNISTTITRPILKKVLGRHTAVNDIIITIIRAMK